MGLTTIIWCIIGAGVGIFITHLIIQNNKKKRSGIENFINDVESKIFKLSKDTLMKAEGCEPKNCYGARAMKSFLKKRGYSYKYLGFGCSSGDFTLMLSEGEYFIKFRTENLNGDPLDMMEKGYIEKENLRLGTDVRDNFKIKIFLTHKLL